MSKRFPRAKWTLPETIDPEERLCFTIQVPNEPYHIAAFRGALLNLASAINWSDDPEHKAKDVADVWKQIYDEVNACIMAVTDVRQNDENPCTLEKQIDGGEWEEFADLQLCPPRMRMNEGRMQWWDGESWVDLPGQGEETEDGSYDPPFPDPPPGETGNCLAAENLTALLQQQVTEWASALTAGAIALGIVTIITGVLSAFFIPYATPAILGFATTIIGIGASGLTSAFDSDVYDRFKCIISCNASSDGSITVAQYDDIVADVQAESGTAWDLIEIWLSFFGNVGLNRAATSAGITTGDCDDCGCEWCVEFDFETGAHGWFDESPYGVYTSGVGFETTCYNNGGSSFEAWAIMFNLPAGCVISRSEFIYDANIVSGNSANFRYDVSGARTYHFFTPETGTDVSEAENNTVSDSLTQIGFSIVAQSTFGYPNCTGWATLKKAILRGTGTIPSGGVEC